MKDTGGNDEVMLPYLTTFAKAAELGSFTLTGQALGVSQAAISQRVHALERDLGVTLFHREGGRVSLTEAGKRLHGYATRIIGLHHEARAEVTATLTQLTGELSLAASSVPGEHILPAVLSAFGQKYPHVRVRATITDSGLVFDHVEHGQAQLGLVGMTRDNPHLEIRPFAHDEMVLVVPKNHQLAMKESVTIDELRGERLILRESGSGSRQCLEQALASAGRTIRDLNVTLDLGSNEAIKEAVLHGMGVAILSTHVIQKELDAGLVRALTVAGLPLKRDIFVMRDVRRALPIPAQLFRDFLMSTQP